MALDWALPMSILVQLVFLGSCTAAAVPGHPRIYFAEVPDYFKSNPFEPRKGGALDDRIFGSHLLGNLISRDAELWTTHWSVVDLWWIKQMFISPLRVHEYAVADIVFVAAVLDPQMANDAQCASFFEDFAPKHLPFIKSKPHILLLSHGLVYQNPGWEGKHPRCWQHPGARHFTILSQEAMAADVDPQPVSSDWSNFVAFPMMARTHFHRGGLRLWSKFNADAVAARKTKLVFSSFLVKRYPAYPSRSAAHAQCLAAPRLCEHYAFDSSDEPHSISQVQKGFERSWYSLMPHADFKIRNSFYDALIALCMPVVFEANFVRHLPFTDIVDYSVFVKYVDENLFVPKGANASVVQILAEDHIEADALESLQVLHNIAHVFQYMENPAHDLIRFDQRNTAHPEDDAFTFTMKAVLRNLCRRGKLEPKRCQASSRQHSISRIRRFIRLDTEGKKTSTDIR